MTKLSINPISLNSDIKNLARTEITLVNDSKTKIKHSPFVVVNPTSIKDMNLLCDYLNELTEKGISLKNLGGVSYRVFEYDAIVEEIKNRNQLDLNFKRTNESFINIEKYFFKFIEPYTYLYRDRWSTPINKILKLGKIPDYLATHLQWLINKENKEKDTDYFHIKFWKNLYAPDSKTGRNKSAHFIKWHENLQKSRGADIFLPPAPYIKEVGGEFLVEKAIEINSDSFDVAGGDVATYFEFDIEIFRNKNIIDRILNYISENPNKCRFVVFKIHDVNKIINKGFGLSSLEHFELFLRTLKSIKENKDTIVGLLDGAGFGYCLLGSVADFFTDTMHNYSQDPPPKRKGKIIIKKPRQFLNYFTLSLERFSDVENYFLDHECLPCHCWICEEKYNILKTFNQRVIDWDEWSNDCKKHALNVWEMVTQELINAMVRGDENLFFERIARTDYVKLAKIIRKISL